MDADLQAYLEMIDGKLDLVVTRIGLLQTWSTDMSAEVDRLKASVANLATIDQSVVTLLGGLTAQIRTLQNDPAALTALADEVDARVSELNAAVTANTPATTTAAPTTSSVAPTTTTAPPAGAGGGGTTTAVSGAGAGATGP